MNSLKCWSNRRFVKNCNEAIMFYRQLEEDKKKIPPSLVDAIIEYVRIESRSDDEPVKKFDIIKMDDPLIAILQLFLYYGGEIDKKTAISTIQEYANQNERLEIQKILMLKNKLEGAAGGGIF